MNPVVQIFKNHSPHFFSYLLSIKEGVKNIPSFIFHGVRYSGKEWTAIKTLQVLNCQQFLDPNHHPLFCPTCSRINQLHREEGVFLFLNTLPLEDIRRVLLRELPDIKETTDPLLRESIIHEISKIGLFLEAQFLVGTGGTKKIGVSKYQEIGEQLSFLRQGLMRGKIEKNQILNVEKLLNEEALFQGDMGLSFLRFLLNKLSMSALHPTSYRILILKDPALLKYQDLILNTLLKTIEDPRNRFSCFLLTEKKDRILPTIRSRSQTLTFFPPSDSYWEDVKKVFPHYHPLLTPTDKLYSPSLSEIEQSPPLEQKSLILTYLEKKKASYIGISPLLQEKKQEIENLIVGIKEYNLSLKNILEILPYL